MAGKCILHFRRAPFEDLQQVSVPVLEIVERCGKQGLHFRFVERENPVDNVIGSRLVDIIEIARFDRRLEWAHHHA